MIRYHDSLSELLHRFILVAAAVQEFFETKLQPDDAELASFRTRMEFIPWVAGHM